MPVEREENVIELCREAVDRLAGTVPSAQLSCHVRVGDTLRVVALAGELRVIYEVPRAQGGIGWRAVETGETQVVEDVRSDPDYLATDENVVAEIVVPVRKAGDVAVLLDAEFPERPFTAAEAEAVQAEGARLERDLAD